MFGTFVNVITILAGGLVGLLVRGGLKEKYKEIITQAIGMAVLFVGVPEAVRGLLEPDAHPVLFIISLALGGLIGEGLGIETALKKLGDFLQSKFGSASGGSFSTGFVNASLLFCVGTMAILGPLDSGLKNDHSVLYAKSVLDGITSVVLASSLGAGVLFSAVSVLLYQGAVTLLAVGVSVFVTADILREISIVGGVMITAIGLNMLGITKIRVGNLLPALLVPIIYYLLAGLFV